MSESKIAQKMCRVHASHITAARGEATADDPKAGGAQTSGSDIKVVRALCHRVMVMQHGRIVEEGPVDEVLVNPRTDYTRRLVRAAFEIAT